MPDADALALERKLSGSPALSARVNTQSSGGEIVIQYRTLDRQVWG